MYTSYKFLFFVLISLFLTSKCDGKNSKRILYSILDGQYLKIYEVDDESNIPEDYLARTLFEDKINSTGWAFLDLQTSGNKDDDKQAYSAGFLEGVVTQKLMWMHWQNTMADMCKGRKVACLKIKLFINRNKSWMNSIIKTKSETDPYWYQVKLYLRQLEGLADGYNKAVTNPKENLPKDYVMAMSLQFDIEDLFAMEGIKKPVGFGHCSGLIKLLPDYSDVYVSHVSWSGYETMLRIQKKYVLKYKVLPNSNEIIPGHTMSFSSYPGILFSGDDFYTISSGLVAFETTISNDNSDLWQYVKPSGEILAFMRTMIANRMADSGQSWTNIFAKYNSGTYNNQWLVIDYKKFKPGSLNGVKPEFLWMLEQMPGTTESKDITQFFVEQTYWPSYNIPYFPTIFNISGGYSMIDKYGDWFDYNKHPRALIFKRDHGNVKNMDDMLALMRYNDFKHDPLSKCDCEPPYSAENAISARNDLNLKNGTYPFPFLTHRYRGALDAKITNVKLAKAYQFLSISGPTYNETRGLPPFKWSEIDADVTISHNGHPDLWQFKPITYSWPWE